MSRSGCHERASLPWTADNSEALRSTQNSLLSGSASTAQPDPSGRRRSLTSVAPSSASRSTSASRVQSAGRRQRCWRFFTTLCSGTDWKMSSPPCGSGIPTSSSRGSLSGCTGRASTADQNAASLQGSSQSIVMLQIVEAIPTSFHIAQRPEHERQSKKGMTR
ncbi:MAG: hypothetical protein DLM70_14575 [Chloroflexi bacterium]|nr:MAG: hypothetical protein DLM70_14575 [Chloroflexota bacterium]